MGNITLLVDRDWRNVPHAVGGTLVHVSSVRFATLLTEKYPPGEILALYRRALKDPEFVGSEDAKAIIKLALDASDYRDRGLDPASVDTLFVDPETLRAYGIYDATLRWVKERNVTYVPLPHQAIA